MPNKNTPNLNLQSKVGQSDADTLAEAAVKPSINSAILLHSITSVKYNEATELNSLVKELSSQAEKVQSGDMGRAESMLISQAHTLDGLFLMLCERSFKNMGENVEFTEKYMRLALKAQSQCATTLKVLGELKNPKQVSFVKQANIAQGHQQVNNGHAQKADSGSRAEIKNQQNELLEQKHGERLDFGAQGAPEASDTELEAVGAVNRPKDGAR